MGIPVYRRAITLVVALTVATAVVGCGTSINEHPSATGIVGHYQVVGTILVSSGFSEMHAGDQLSRDWWITRSCVPAGCQLVLTRDLAAESAVPPISATLIPVNGGWTAHFVERGGCPGPGSAIVSTEYSTWTLNAVNGGLQATEHGYSPAVRTPTVGCAPSRDAIQWSASKLP